MPLTNGVQDAAAVNSFGRPYSLWMALDNVPGFGTADSLEVLALTRDDVTGAEPPPPTPSTNTEEGIVNRKGRVTRGRR